MTVQVLATVKLPRTTGNPRDDVANDFVFEAAASELDDATADDIAAELTSFYNTTQVIPGTDQPVGGLISALVSRSTDAIEIAMYDITGLLDGSPHGSPLQVRNFTLVAETVAANRMPAEVAIGLSFHGNLTGLPEVATNPTPPPATIRPAARHRGRIYLGPLAISASVTSSGRVLVATDAADCIASAASALAAETDAVWQVWSRANAEVYPVVGGWVDNAFDTVRKRGEDMTSRTLWT